MFKARLVAIAGSGAVHVVVVGALLLQPTPALRTAGRDGDLRGLEVDLIRSDRQAFEAEREPVAAPAKAASPAVAETPIKSAAPLVTAATPSAGGNAEDGGAPAAAAAAPAAGANYNDYERALLEHIRSYQFYPDGGRAQRLQGVVKIGFVVQRDGKVAQIWIETSSGRAVLDQAAMETIRRAQPLPNIPAALPDSVSVVLPVMFSAPQLLSQQ